MLKKREHNNKVRLILLIIAVITVAAVVVAILVRVQFPTGSIIVAARINFDWIIWLVFEQSGEVFVQESDSDLVDLDSFH
jgi:hypothetical protein